MTLPTPSTGPQVPRQGAGAAAFFGRAFWVLFGPVLLLVIGCGIITSGSGWFTALDALFLAIVVLMAGGRWLESRSPTAMTATGEPATRADFRRYLRVLVPVALGVWALANLLGNHLLSAPRA